MHAQSIMHYPVHFEVAPPDKYSRLGLALRILAIVVVVAAGLSSGGIFCVLYFGLPVFAATGIASRRSCTEYAAQDGPRVLLVLGWLAAVTAWLHLAVDRLPNERPDETIHLSIEGRPSQTPARAAGRVILGLPSAVVLGFLSLLGAFVWVWASLSILVAETVPRSAWAYLVGLERYTYRLLAYQAALVDDYPPFTLSEPPNLTKASSVG